MHSWRKAKNEITGMSEVQKKSLTMVAELVTSLTKRRIDIGMSQRELAENIGMLQPAIARIESGSVLPRLETLSLIAVALDMELTFQEAEVVYNPLFGDDKLCECGHAYYRHFDTYEDMRPVGCKYCECYDFKPAKESHDS